MKLTEQDIKNIARREARSTTRSYAASYGGGGVSEAWVGDNFVSKEFFNCVLVVTGTKTVTVTDEDDEPVGDPVVTDYTFAPNEVPETTTETDSDTGYTTTTVTVITKIQALGGLWTNSFVSALGQGGSGGGGGGGASALYDLLDVSANSTGDGVLNAQDGYVLTYDSTTGKWKAAPTASAYTHPTNGANTTITAANGKVLSAITVNKLGHVTSVSSKTLTTSDIPSLSGTYLPLTGGTMTGQIVRSSGGMWVKGRENAALRQNGGTSAAWSPVLSVKTYSGTWEMGAISDSSAVQNKLILSYVTDTDYGNSTNNSVKVYFPTSAGTIALTSDNVASATKLYTARSLWGKSFDGTADVSGDIYAGSSGGSILQFHGIELNSAGTLSGNGGYIDFHYNGSSSDYTSRISETASGILSLIGSGAVVGNNANGDYLQIGSIRLVYDSTNNALKVIKADGTAANFYSTGGVSALGLSSGSGGSIDTLTVDNALNIANNKRIYFKNSAGSLMSAITVDSVNNLVLGEAWTPSGYNTYVRGNYVFIQTGTSYTTCMTINANGYTTFSGYVQSSRFYLDASRYLYLSGSSLMYYNGSTSIQIA